MEVLYPLLIVNVSNCFVVIILQKFCGKGKVSDQHDSVMETQLESEGVDWGANTSVINNTTTTVTISHSKLASGNWSLVVINAFEVSASVCVCVCVVCVNAKGEIVYCNHSIGYNVWDKPI